MVNQVVVANNVFLFNIIPLLLDSGIDERVAIKNMLMTSIRDYVQLKGRADLQDIARHFQLPESASAQMLDFWVKKGTIKLISLAEQNSCSSGQCSDCFSCNSDLNSKAVYAWIPT